MGQACEVETPGLPKSSRHAWTVALNGFQSAMWRSQGVMLLESTNAFDTKVTGKSQTSPPEVAASGVRTDSPMTAPIQVNAYPVSSRSPNAAGTPPRLVQVRR